MKHHCRYFHQLSYAAFQREDSHPAPSLECNWSYPPQMICVITKAGKGPKSEVTETNFVRSNQTWKYAQYILTCAYFITYSVNKIYRSPLQGYTKSFESTPSTAISTFEAFFYRFGLQHLLILLEAFCKIFRFK